MQVSCRMRDTSELDRCIEEVNESVYDLVHSTCIYSFMCALLSTRDGTLFSVNSISYEASHLLQQALRANFWTASRGTNIFFQVRVPDLTGILHVGSDVGIVQKSTTTRVHS